MSVSVFPGAFGRSYHNGKLDGVFTMYRDNSFPLSMVTYREGKRDGLTIEFTATGFTTNRIAAPLSSSRVVLARLNVIG